MTMLMERVGLLEPLRGAIEHGLPVLATCAGMIVLAMFVVAIDLLVTKVENRLLVWRPNAGEGTA